MSARLLVLTAGFGEGHNAAARALAAACDTLHSPGTARVADVFALAAPRLNAVVPVASHAVAPAGKAPVAQAAA